MIKRITQKKCQNKLKSIRRRIKGGDPDPEVATFLERLETHYIDTIANIDDNDKDYITGKLDTFDQKQKKNYIINYMN